jgi:hypothetical protein
MQLEQFVALAVGAFLGSFGWLLVGMYLSRRANVRVARSAARAVYFELAMNEIDVDVASTHSVFSPLRRSTFDRLLPELASWLAPDELESLVRAYMSHAGYEQVQRDDKLPAPVRAAVLSRVVSEHRQASEMLLTKAFTAKEAARLSTLARSHGGVESAAAPATIKG